MALEIICWWFGTIQEVREPKTCIRDDCPWYTYCTGNEPGKEGEVK